MGKPWYDDLINVHGFKYMDGVIWSLIIKCVVTGNYEQFFTCDSCDSSLSSTRQVAKRSSINGVGNNGSKSSFLKQP